jgi:hypothetical protein
MGCGSSSSTDDNFKTRSTPDDEKKVLKDKFNNNLQAMKKLCEEIGFRERFMELITQEHEQFEEMFDPFWETYKKKLEEEKFTHETLKDISQAIAAQTFLEQHLDFKEYDIHDTIKQFTNYIRPSCQDFTDGDMETLMNTIKIYQNVFPSLQKGVLYFVESLRTQNFALGHININLKLNPDFELKAFNIGIFEENLENIQFLKGLAEVIDYSQALTCVAIQILQKYDDKLIDKKYFRNLCILLESIKANKNIKVLLISLVKGEETMELGPEVNNKILEIVKQDNLLALYFVKVAFNPEFGKKLGSLIEDSQNLRFLGFASSENNPAYLTSVFQGINKNNSLNIVCLQKFEIPEAKMTELKGLVTGCKTLKLFKYFKEDGL